MFTFWLSFSSRSGDKTEHLLQIFGEKKKEKCHTLFVFCIFLFTFAEESNETRSSVQHTAAAAVQVKEEVTIYHHSGILGARFGDSLSWGLLEMHWQAELKPNISVSHDLCGRMSLQNERTHLRNEADFLIFRMH